MHANSLNSVDLSNLDIAHSAYFKLMAPLSFLPVKSLNMEGTADTGLKCRQGAWLDICVCGRESLH